MLLGIDVSTYLEEKEHGAVYLDGNTPMEPLEAFRENGVSMMRIRLWNNPYSREGTPYLAGTCDLENLLRLGAAAKEKGYGILLDFHYSDFWVDPGKQTLPKAWEGLEEDGVVQALYTFTKETLEQTRRAGLPVEMIQIGNEITNGMVWPFGKLTEGEPRGNYPALIRLLKAGIRACREVLPSAKLVLHLERVFDTAVYREFFTQMEKAQVDYDVIGATYYPWWHGTFDQFFHTMTVCRQFGKERMVMETGYGFTMEDYIKNGNGLVVCEGHMDTVTYSFPYPVTPEGQASFLKDFLTKCRENGIDGVFYWEPLWIPGDGICWASEAGQTYIHEEGKPTRNEWANQCLFDYSGRKLPAFDCFCVSADSSK